MGPNIVGPLVQKFLGMQQNNLAARPCIFDHTGISMSLPLPDTFLSSVVSFEMGPSIVGLLAQKLFGQVRALKSP